MTRGVKDAYAASLAHVVTIMRTEQLDAYRSASLESWRANSDVLAGWQWVAELGPRTCRACISLHGRVFPLSDPGPEDHPNGRCTGAPVTKSWSELGFKDIPHTSMQIDPGAGEAWLRRQSEGVQQHILGKRGQAAWAAGQWPATEWAARKESANWRGYFTQANQPTPVEIVWRDGGDRRIPVIAEHEIVNSRGEAVRLFEVDKRYASQMAADLKTVYDATARGKQVTVFTDSELKEFSRLFTTTEGLAGAGIKNSGEIGALYSLSPTNGVGEALVRVALGNRGTYLECFDTFLPAIYSRAGLDRIATIPFNREYAPDGWDYQAMALFNNGEPDIVFMVRKRDGLEVRRFDDWDDAEAYTRANLG